MMPERVLAELCERCGGGGARTSNPAVLQIRRIYFKCITLRRRAMPCRRSLGEVLIRSETNRFLHDTPTCEITKTFAALYNDAVTLCSRNHASIPDRSIIAKDHHTLTNFQSRENFGIGSRGPEPNNTHETENEKEHHEHFKRLQRDTEIDWV